MTRRNRETLKNFFREGQRPGQEHFADLIDSMLNMGDEGFRLTVENGQELSAPRERSALQSFFRSENPENPLWSVGFGEGRDQLLFRPGQSVDGDGTRPGEGSLLCLDPQGRLGVGTEAPQAELDVAGTLRSRGRTGSYPGPSDPAPAQPPKADGRWHDLTGDLGGFQAFEVMAGAARRNTGRVAMVHAIALNTYNPTWGIFDFLNRSRGIRCTHAYYSRRFDRLSLRWKGSSGKNAVYRLQIRSGSDYGEDAVLKVQLTRLWDTPILDPQP